MPVPIDHLVQSKRKTIALIIQRDGTLTVRAPLRMSDVHIQEFVQKHYVWIRNKQAQAKESPALPNKHFVNGEPFLYLGIEYPLTLVAHQRPALSLSNNKFHLANSNLPKASQVFIRWYKDQARNVISERVAFHAKKYKFTYKKIRISSARTRWGSCSSNGTLSFTWRLVMAPMEIVDYVVLHEMVHTQIKNHSKIFWQKVGDILPEYKKRVRWLKQNGKYLSL